tara:strand:- start:3644 stop:4075 length:432 start_codon:yes stop_codon:yes gene_type:complete
MKNLAILIGLCVSTAAYADPQFTDLQEGDPAPFDGKLFNYEAVSQLIVSRELAEEECDIETQYQLDLQAAQHQLEVERFQIRYDGLQERYDAMNLLKDDEVARLQDLIGEHPNRRSVWMFAGGVVAGIGTSIAIMYATAELTD